MTEIGTGFGLQEIVGNFICDLILLFERPIRNDDVLTVGIAYGSDVTRAIQLVQETAEEHERVLEEPPVLVTFENFADYTINDYVAFFYRVDRLPHAYHQRA